MLESELRANTSLPLSREANLVFGEGDPDAPAVFIGEAPGFHEDRLGRPFVGTAGKLLDKLIEGIGWRREDVYITNIVKRRPPKNRDPLPEEIEAYAPYLSRQIEILAPKAIIPLGRFAMNYFLPDAKISRDQGKIFLKDGMKVIPMFHPAAALRATAVMETLKESFSKLPALIANAPEDSSSLLPKTINPPPNDHPSPVQSLF